MKNLNLQSTKTEAKPKPKLRKTEKKLNLQNWEKSISISKTEKNQSESPKLIKKKSIKKPKPRVTSSEPKKVRLFFSFFLVHRPGPPSSKSSQKVHRFFNGKKQPAIRWNAEILMNFKRGSFSKKENGGSQVFFFKQHFFQVPCYEPLRASPLPKSMIKSPARRSTLY